MINLETSTNVNLEAFEALPNKNIEFSQRCQVCDED
jgi:hypothetical protein